MIFDLRYSKDVLQAQTLFKKLSHKKSLIELKERKKSRTLSQNNAIHLWCEMIAEELNEIGATFEYLKFSMTGETIELPFTAVLVKETLWRPIQKSLTKKESTTKLNKDELTPIIQAIEKFLAERDIDLPFPSLDNSFK